MTALQIASLYIMPIGALLIGLGLYYFTGPPSRRRHKLRDPHL